MDISQYKELFITEAQEHLDHLNKFLLQLEGDPGNLDVITEIFRSAHTLKGMSATMGYDQLTELAHEMENLLEHLRTGEVTVTGTVIDTLFLCFDTLDEIVSAISRDMPETVDYSEAVSEIRAVVGLSPAGRSAEGERERFKEREDAARREDRGEGGPVAPGGREFIGGGKEKEAGPGDAGEEPGGEGRPRDDVEREHAGADRAAGGRGRPAVLEIGEDELERYARTPGTRVLRVTVELDRDCLLKSVRVFMVFKKLAQLGEVIASSPPVEALEDEKFDLTFQVGITTREANERVERALLGIAEITKVTAETLLEAKEAGPPERPPPERAAPLTTARRTQSVRVNIARLDTLMNLVGELVINRTRLSEIVSSVDSAELREALDQTSRLTSELQDEIMKTRMVPVEHIFNRFPRMVRDLSRAEGKEIDFFVEGKDIELDRTILDEISDPLMHMIRNAVDHGIATPGERERSGKPRRGAVRLSAYRERNYVAIEVEDDGVGIDAGKAFDVAVRKGLISAGERASLEPGDLLRVIALPGFTMSEEVSGVSGRGVGMDAIKLKAESLGGFVTLDTAPGRGTRVALKLPLTLAIVQALMVEVSGDTYAIPMATVRETHVINPSDIRSIQNKEVILLRDETIPLLRLDRVLGCSTALDGSEPIPVVINEIGTRLIAVAVHSLIGQMEIVISTLDDFLKGIDGFAGATILGTGRVALILDIPGLL